jgi:hypothetical protein
MESNTVDHRIDIPEPLLRHRSRLGARWAQTRALNYILNKVQLDDYDASIFLAYETISFSLRWPKKQITFLFEHNNIENALGSLIKTFFYRRLSPNVVHLAFQNHIAEYIRDACGRNVVHVPHPHYRNDVSDSGINSDTALSRRSEDRTIIFSPSGSTPSMIQDELKMFVSTTNGAHYAICKGKHAEKTDDWEVFPFFDNYEVLMRKCDMVFLGARHDYRVSGVAFEALSYGKAIALLDSPFARELNKSYPHLVFPIKTVGDILGLETNPEKMRGEHALFLREHSFDSVRANMIAALGT